MDRQIDRWRDKWIQPNIRQIDEQGWGLNKNFRAASLLDTLQFENSNKYIFLGCSGWLTILTSLLMCI